MAAARLLTARRVLATAELLHEGGGVLVRDGVIEEVLATPGEVERIALRARTEAEDLGDCVLAPGFVDAHAHLELSDLHGVLPAGLHVVVVTTVGDRVEVGEVP